MEEADFWAVIDRTRTESGGDLTVQRELAYGILSALAPDEVLWFRRRLVAANRRAYTWPLWNAAALHQDNLVGDDQFTDFRTWLVCHGRETYERVLADPDTLADLTYDEDMNDFGAAEIFGTVADEVYEELTGEGVGDDEDILEPIDPPPDSPPSLGNPDDPDSAPALRRAFPRLAAAYYA